MTMPLVSSFGRLALSIAPAFTQPSFANLAGLLTGWVFCLGCHAVTGLIVAAGAVSGKDFSCYHRFFGRASWCLGSVGRVVLGLVLHFVPEGETVLVAVDDALGRKTGRHIRGAAMHHDPLRSTPSRPVFSFGHSWVVISIIVPLPFVSRRRFAIPFMLRLHRKKAKKRPPGRPKGERKTTGDAKQSLGFEEPQSRTRKAVERTAPMAFVVHSLTVLRYAEHGTALREKWFVGRPWCRRRRGPSFADMPATLRQASWVEASSRDPGRRQESQETPPQTASAA